jgi:pyruvate dehydrogenase E2 component (dihydrolipoamide acetyltransferase)/2-oxoglutarate dehydrogenase E2 component (dihydrolipoamide succinyltransferase)
MSVDEVNLVEWKFAEGEKVAKGDVVCVIETQKTEWNIEAEDGGLLHIIVEAGSKTGIGSVVGQIAESEEELRELQERGAAGMPRVETAQAPPPVVTAQAPAAPVQKEAAGRILITPVARKLAEEHMIDLAGIVGTGPGGRITREDVQQAIDTKPVPAKEIAPEVFQGKKVKESIVLRGMRKAIAEHMFRSLSTAAQMTVMGEIDMTEAVRLKDSLSKYEKDIGAKIGFVDILVFVLSRALIEHPDMNCTLIGNELKIWEDINIGVAVALGKEGLIVPVIKNTDRLTLKAISEAVRKMAEKAQSGQIAPDDLSGGTFTLTSLGRRGTSMYQTPILNQPESAILATGPINDRPVVRDGQIVIAPIMPFSLTFDHRAINGFGAELFMGKVQTLLAAPGLLLV